METLFRYMNGTASQRTIFVCIIVSPSMLFGLCALQYGIQFSPVGIEAFSIKFAKIGRTLTLAFTLVFFACWMLAYKSNLNAKVANWILNISVVSTSIVANTAIYFAGSVSSSVVLLLASAGVVMIMVLPAKQSRKHIAFLLLLYASFVLLALADWIPYAPMVLEAPDYHRSPSVFWSIAHGLFGLTSLVIVFLFAEFVLQRTRSGQKELLHLSRTDPLTSLSNRRYLMERFDAEVVRATRKGRSLTCIIFDVDHFKRINDQHGHLAGDSVLRTIATVLSSEKREYDISARFGGDEFILVLPESDQASAISIAERLISTLALSDLCSIEFTLSIGIASLDTEAAMDTSEKLLLAADRALYKAKQAGRNRYEVGS